MKSNLPLKPMGMNLMALYRPHHTTSTLLSNGHFEPGKEILLLASGDKLILPWLHNGKRMIEGRQKTHCTQSEENYLTIEPTI